MRIFMNIPELDEVDRRILNMLQQNAAMTNAELALSLIHISEPTRPY